MKKILFVGGYPNKEEPVRNVFFQKLIWQMADSGIDCTVIAPVPIRSQKTFEIELEQDEKTDKGSLIHVYRPKYFSCSSKRIFGFNTLILSEMAFRRAVRTQAKKMDMIQFDAVYGHFILRGGMAAVELSRKYGMPAYFACGESDIYKDTFNGYPISMAKMISECKGVISVSTKNKKDLIAAGLFKDEDILVAPNAIDITLFHTGDKLVARKQMGFPEEGVIAAFAGYFIERKGDKRVCEAGKGLNIHMAFAGKGNNPPASENVIMAKPLLHDQMPVFYQAADFFVLPTLAEGCCNSIVEAMACGLPIISSDLPFNDDILTDENSIRIDPMNVGEIRDAMIRIASDETMRRKMSRAALDTASKLTIEERCRTILTFMDEKAHTRG